jgi:hypothetical protein
MTQTITLQRGQITATSGSTNLVFTNAATGTATRLVVGYLSYKLASNTDGKYCNFGIRRSGASSGSEVVFASSVQPTYGNGMSFSPHDTTSQSNINFGATTASFTKSFNGGLLGSPTQVGSGIYYNAAIAYYNNTTMIGPSDAVYCYYAEDAGIVSAVIQYNFVLITET